jgi:3-dehydroquinate dehydratase-1
MTRAKIVGVISSRADLRRALRLRKPPDLFELRLDRLFHFISEVDAAFPGLPAAAIVTARAPREGGANKLNESERRTLLLRFLPRAAYLDVELRSAKMLRPVLRSASQNKIATIISFHDFQTTPPAFRLDEIVSRARSLGASLIKVATRTDTAAQLERLLDFFERHRGRADVVAMGIGKLGRASRRQLVRRGCLLNYGHLGSPGAPGQLSVAELRRFAERADAVS